MKSIPQIPSIFCQINVIHSIIKEGLYSIKDQELRNQAFAQLSAKEIVEFIFYLSQKIFKADSHLESREKKFLMILKKWLNEEDIGFEVDALLEEREEWAMQWDKKTPHFLDLAKLIDLENYGCTSNHCNMIMWHLRNIMWSLAVMDEKIHRSEVAIVNLLSEEIGFQLSICDQLPTFNLFDQPASVYLEMQKLGESVQCDTAKLPSDKSNLLDELNAMIGLGEVKKETRKLINLLQIQYERQLIGKKNLSQSLHLVFTGNPGTGKTTVARIIGKLYHSIGVLKKDTFVEVDRSDLVAGYIGQTGPKTLEKLEEAKGGVLFIDEAYSLASENISFQDFGKESISTILKFMEDHRDEICIIVAGYEKEMSKFIESNPGLQSRFSQTIHFEDYSEGELVKIFNKLATDAEYELDEKAHSLISEKINNLKKIRGDKFSNGRDIRNLLEHMTRAHADRLQQRLAENNNSKQKHQEEDLVIFRMEDIIAGLESLCKNWK